MSMFNRKTQLLTPCHCSRLANMLLCRTKDLIFMWLTGSHFVHHIRFSNYKATNKLPGVKKVDLDI